MNDGKDATEKQMNILIGEAYQNGITKGLEESVKDFIKIIKYLLLLIKDLVLI